MLQVINFLSLFFNLTYLAVAVKEGLSLESIGNYNDIELGAWAGIRHVRHDLKEIEYMSYNKTKTNTKSVI